MKCVRILFTILLVNTCICHSVWAAINQDTPNLSFENGAASFSGNFTDDQLNVWKRYYGFYGAENFDAEQIVNKISKQFYERDRATGGYGDEDKDGWVRYNVDLTYTLPDNRGNYPRSGTQPKGEFTVITNRTLDPSVYNTANCENRTPFYTKPLKSEPGQNVVRIGSTGDTEIGYSSYEPNGYYRRAMAEKMAYSFIVKENSTLLTVQFAAFLEDPDDPSNPNQDGAHVADERPTTSVSVTLKKNGTGNIVKPVCSEYEASLNNAQLDLGIIEKECNNYDRNSKPSRYKDWTTNVYDLRENIGDTVTIEVWVHDCLLELPVCTNCKRLFHNTKTTVVNGIPYVYCYKQKRIIDNIDGIAGNRQWSNVATAYGTPQSVGCGGSYPAKIKPTAGGHRAYCYFTACTKKMEMLVDNCPENDKITITAPTGFTFYNWYTGEGVSLQTDPNYPNIAYVDRAAIQENMDYICAMSGDDEDCSQIYGIVQLAKEPLGAKFSKNISCDNEVSFVNESFIKPIKQQSGDTIEPDTITKYVWTCTDGHNITYQKTTYEAGKDSTPTYVLEYNQQNKGRYTVTLDIYTKKGCHASYTEEISVSPREEISIDGVTDVCLGESTTLQISNYNDPENEYNWYTVEGGNKTNIQSGVGYNASLLNLTPTGTMHIYVDILQDENGYKCHYNKEFDVTTKPIPTINASGTGHNTYMDRRPKQVDICEAENANLTASETTHLGISKWTWSDLKNTANNTVSPQDTTLYYISAEANNGCVTKDSIQVNVMKKPDLAIVGGDEICVNDPITLRATGAGDGEQQKKSYMWYSVSNDQERLINATDTTSAGSMVDSLTIKHKHASRIGSDDYLYRLYGTNEHGCSSYIDKQVVVREKPSPIIPDLAPVCKGDNVTISIYGGDEAKIEEEGTTEFHKIPYTKSIASSYDSLHVIVRNNYNSVSCQTTISKPVVKDSVPGIKITGDTEICSGGTITLQAQDTTIYPSNVYPQADYPGANTYQWTDANHTTTATMTAKPNTSTTYGVTVTNKKNCSARKEVPITVHPLPRVIVEAKNGKVCPGGTDTIRAVIVKDGDTIALTECHWYTESGAELPASSYSDISKRRNNDTIRVTGINAQTSYIVKGKDENGCEKSAQVSIYLKTPPTITIAGDTIVCNHSNISLTAAGAESYNWEKVISSATTTIGSTNPLTEEANYTQDTEIKYIVRGTKDGCEGSNTKTVHVYKEPTITIKGRKEVCYGDTAQLVASGTAAGKKYLWTGLGKDNDTVIVAPIGTSQVFQVTGYNEKNCPGTATHTITINDNPTLTIDGANPVCKGGKATNISVRNISQNGGALKNIEWRIFDKKRTGEGTVVTNPGDVVLNDTTIFFVKAQNGSDCPATAEATVIVYPEPKITVIAPPVCQGEEIVATVDGAANYRWYRWSAGNDTIFADEVNTKYTDGNYTETSQYRLGVIGYENGCPSKLKDTIIPIKAKPSFSIKGNTTYCENDVMNLQADGIDDANVKDYLWSTGDNTRNFSKNALLSMTSIKLTITNKDGCTDEREKGIIVKKKPSISILASKNAVCENDTLTMLASYEKDPQSISLNYTWGYKEKGQNDYTPYTDAYKSVVYKFEYDSIHPSVATTTTYKVTGTETHNYILTDGGNLTCVSSAEKTIVADPIPVVYITGEDSVCSGTATNLIAFNKNSNAIIQRWEWESANFAPGETHNLSYTNTGAIYAQSYFTAKAYTDKCKGEATDTINVYPDFKFTIGGDRVVCENDSFKIYAVPDANNQNKKISDYTYQWSPQGGKSDTAQGVIFETTAFSLLVTDKNGCTTQADNSILYNKLPVLTLSAGTVCENESVTINVNADSLMKQIVWKDGSITHDFAAPYTLTDHIEETISQSTTFSVKGTDKNGCVSVEEIIVVDPLIAPDLSVTGVTKACAGSNVDIIAATSTQFDVKWYKYDNSTIGEEVTATSGDISVSNGVLSLESVKEGTYDYIAVVSNGACDTKKPHKLVVAGNPSVKLLTGTNWEDLKEVEICEGNSITTKVAEPYVSGGTYTWNTSSSTDYEQTLSPDNDLTCIVTVTDGNFCTGSDTLKITVNRNPILTINGKSDGDTTICADNKHPNHSKTVNLVAGNGGGSNYRWTDPDGNSISGLTVQSSLHDSLATITVTGNTTIKLSGTSVKGCPGTTTYTINTKEYPTFDAKDTSACIGDYATVKVRPGGNADTYEWKWTENGQEKTANGTNHTEILNEALKVYQLTATKDGCTSEPKTVNVTGNAKPTLTVSGDATICFGKETTLQVGGADTYEWTRGNGLTDNGQGSATVKPNATGVHKYIVRGSYNEAHGGCYKDTTISVNVIASPNFIVKGDKTICAGSKLTLSAEDKSNSNQAVTFTLNGKTTGQTKLQLELRSSQRSPTTGRRILLWSSQS